MYVEVFQVFYLDILADAVVPEAELSCVQAHAVLPVYTILYYGLLGGESFI